MLANKIKPKIQKVINKFPTTVSIYRSNKNEFGEPMGEEKVIDVTGYYHDSTSSVETSLSTSESGSITIRKAKYLMVVLDEETSKIKVFDYLYLDGIKHRIIDLDNRNKFNIYYDLLLEEVV